MEQRLRTPSSASKDGASDPPAASDPSKPSAEGARADEGDRDASTPVNVPLVETLSPGMRPLDHLRRVLGEMSHPWAPGGLLVLTHKSPDPDALGAMAGMGFLLERAFGLKHEIATTGRIFRAENMAMVRELGLHFADYHAIDPSHYTAALLVDTQPSFGHTFLPEGLPIMAVFDHHEPPANGGVDVRIPHFDLRLGLGATCTMIYEYIRDAGLELDARTATALCCGVRFDTGDLSNHVTALDTEAFHQTFRFADRRMLARINRPVLPSTYYRELHQALSRARSYGPLVYGLLGRVSNPESVAEMADFFLRLDDARWSFVGGAYEGVYHLSLRTEVGFADAYPLMAAILDGEGSFGGRGSVAGGQIPLENPDDATINNLQRRLRKRALKLVDPAELQGADKNSGIRLTRLP